MDDLNSKATAVQAGSIDFAALGHPDLAAQYSTPEMQQKVDCLQLQARVSEVGWRGGGKDSVYSQEYILEDISVYSQEYILEDISVYSQEYILEDISVCSQEWVLENIHQFTAWNGFLEIYISLQPGLHS